MEVNRYQPPKKIHHHSLPIVIIAIAVLVVSTPFVLRQKTLSGNGAALIHDLSTRTINISPTPKGFAHITLNNNTNGQLNPEVTQAGRTAELMFNLGSNNP